MLRVVVLGYGELAQAIVLGILQTQHELVGVMKWKGQNSNRIYDALKDIFAPDSFLSIIKSKNLKEIKARRANSKAFIKEMKKIKPDVIIVGSWGEIIKKEVIELPRVAFINCHPSLLPKHRGSNPYTSVIRAGEAKTGITFHLMSEKIDAGDILFQREVPISELDTGQNIRNKCAFKAKEAVKVFLEQLEKGALIPIKQQETESSYFPALSEDDAIIDWNKPANFIHNQIRGLHPWISCYTSYKNDFLFIKSSEIVNLKNFVYEPGKILEKDGESLLISTGDPQKAILAKDVEVYGFLSKVWSKQYLDSNLKIGTCFRKILV